MSESLEKRLERERLTIEKMVGIYCRAHHDQADEGLCVECQELLTYAGQRLERCKFREDKPPCSKCPVHCYRESMREKVLAVMRYAGPRMLHKHPVLAVHHLLDSVGKDRPKES